MCVLLLQSSMESPNLEFEYGDTDTLTAELSGKATDRHPLALDFVFEASELPFWPPQRFCGRIWMTGAKFHPSKMEHSHLDGQYHTAGHITRQTIPIKLL